VVSVEGSGMILKTVFKIGCGFLELLMKLTVCSLLRRFGSVSGPAPCMRSNLVFWSDRFLTTLLKLGNGLDLRVF
jgi:hypothetical protein